MISPLIPMRFLLKCGYPSEVDGTAKRRNTGIVIEASPVLYSIYWVFFFGLWDAFRRAQESYVTLRLPLRGLF